MGHPITPPIYGDDCEDCYLPGETPKTLLCIITGAKKCPEEPTYGPANGAFLCVQALPCRWDYWDGAIAIYVTMTAAPGISGVSQYNTGRWTFLSNNDSGCNPAGSNELVCTPPFFTGYEGNAFVDTTPWPGTPQKLCDTYGLLPSEGTFTDPYIIDGEPPTTVVYTLANIKYSTKVRIKYDYLA